MMSPKNNTVKPKGKPKEHAISSKRFIIEWLLYGISIWVFGGIFSLPALIVYNNVSQEYLNTLVVVLLVFYVVGVFGLCIGALQKVSVQEHLLIDLRRWQIMSVLGGGIGANIAYLVNSSTPQNNFPVGEIICIVIFISCVGLFQTIELRHHVNKAWLWILANSIGGFVFGTTLFYTRSILILVLPILVQAAITGGMMLWLIQTSSHPKKKKQQPIEENEN